jgi:hypothetical protein
MTILHSISSNFILHLHLPTSLSSSCISFNNQFPSSTFHLLHGFHRIMDSSSTTLCEWRGCTRAGPERCVCDSVFCEEHFPCHVNAKGPSRHRKEASLTARKAWDWVKGNIEVLKDEAKRSIQFLKDEDSKWFGLLVERSENHYITSIVETQRFEMLMERSLFSADASPKRQFPSIVSFVGETGSGKSTISQFVAYCSNFCCFPDADDWCP